MGDSLKLRHRVAVALKGTIDDIGTVVVHVGDGRLVHGAVPLHVAWASVSVSVHILVRQMEHRVLTSPPLTMGIRNWRILGQDTGYGPVEQVRVVGKSLGVKSVIVHYDGSVMAKTLSESSHDEVSDPEVGDGATGVEVLDG
jgi:hypothetical protein